LKKTIAAWLSCILMVGFAVTAARTGFADVPRTINYQGRLTDTNGVAVADAGYSVRISIYGDSSGISLLWSRTYAVTTKNGYYNVVLGDGAPNEMFPVSMDFNQQYYLGIKVGSVDPEMTPLQPLNSAPYALNVARGVASDCWQGIGTGTITNTTEINMIDVPFTLTSTANVVVTAKTRFSFFPGNVQPICRIVIDSIELDRTSECHGAGLTDNYNVPCLGLNKDLTAGPHHAYFKCQMTTGTQFPVSYFDARMIVDAHYK
jgi:hypothetical protein